MTKMDWGRARQREQAARADDLAYLRNSLTDEAESVVRLMGKRELDVFVGSRSGPGSTVVMAGSKTVPWYCAVRCVGEGHAVRAASIVEQYRLQNRSVRKVRRKSGQFKQKGPVIPDVGADALPPWC